MAATTKWIGGTGGLAWVAAGFTATDFNSLAAGNCVVASTAIPNETNLDIYAVVSFSMVVGGTTTANSYLSLYWLPLNQDGTTYGDGTTTGAAAPATQYWLTNVNVLSGVAAGSAVVGTFAPQTVPPVAGKWAIVNNLGVALSATAAALVAQQLFDVNLNG